MMPFLAYTAGYLKQEQLSNEIAADYIDNYLLRLPEERFYSKANIDFVGSFNQRSTDKAFRFFYDHGEKIDRSIGIPGYSRDHIDYIIAKEEIDPRLFPVVNDSIRPIAGNPEWDDMAKRITVKYNQDYAERTILGAKIRWYGYKDDSSALASCYSQKIAKYGYDTTSFGKYALNNIVYNYIFRYSGNRSDLETALVWMESLVKGHPDEAGFLDTYANLLYKLGKTKEAIETEKKAFNMSPSDQEIRTAWEKMKRGESTWRVN